MVKFSLVMLVSVLVLSQFYSVMALTAYDASASEKVYDVAVPTGKSADVVVTVLKYEPYPVIAGEWFDLWVKVQNVGQENAKNLTIQLIPSYPFSSTDNLVRSYGTVYGTVEAYKVDKTYDSSQIIAKYRVKAADNAPSGSSNIKLKMYSDISSSSTEKDLPIEIFSSSKLPTETQTAPTDNSTSISYGIVGLLVGMFLVMFVRILRSKKKSVKAH